MSEAAASAPSGGGDTGGGDVSVPSSEPANTNAEPRQSIPSAQALKNTADREDESDSDSEADSEDKPKKPKPTKLKIKRGGKEAEHTAEELAAMLADDYEHEIPGADGKPTKRKWADLVRDAQLGQGALTKMREAAETRKKFESAIEWGKNPTNIGAFLENQLGVQDHRRWAQDVVAAWLREEAELNDLMQSNPTEYNSRVEAKAAEKIKRQHDIEAHRVKTEQAQRERAEAQKNMDREAAEALKAVGLPVNLAVQAHTQRIHKEYAEVGHKLPMADLAALVKAAYVKDILDFLDGHDDDGLLGLLGDERRKKLRALELKSAKLTDNNGKKKPTDSEGTSTRSESKPNGKKGLTEAEIMKAYR